MSEKTLSQLIGTQIDMEGWHVPRQGQRPFTAMFYARIEQAEAAKAYAAWVVDVPPQATTLDIYATGEGLLREYAAAREAVRKLEGTT